MRELCTLQKDEINMVWMREIQKETLVRELLQCYKIVVGRNKIQ